MILSSSPEVLNFYLNHSSIHPNIAPDGTGYIDGSEILEREDSYFFNFGDGIVLFWLEGDAYLIEAHFLKKGKSAKQKILQAMKEIPGKIRAEIPSFNRASRYMVNSLGFTRTGIKPGAWIKNGVPYDIIQYDWRRNDKHC